MKNIRTPLILIIISIIAVACSSNTPDATSQSVDLTEVNFQMNWIHEYSVAPFHSAVNEGFFANEGLDVTMIAGGFDDEGAYIDPFTQVLSGEAMFGLASATQIIEARNAGSPVVAIMTLLQRSPSVLLSLEETNIQSPQDLDGLTVMMGEDDDLSFSLLLETQGINPEAINIVPRTSFGIDPLLNDEADVMLAWIINEGVQVTESGNTPSYLVLSDYGIDTYSVVVFTSEDAINNNPEMVQSFVDGVVSGIDFAVANPSEAIQNTLTFNPDLEEEGQLRRLNAMIPLMNVPNITTGAMSDETWEFNADLLQDNDLISDDFDVNSAYTTQFTRDASTDS